MAATQYPVFINCRDRLTPLLALIAWLERVGQTDIYLLDNDSAYPPLLEYYRETPHRVVRLGANLGPHALWHAEVLQQVNVTGRFILSDPDVVPCADCPDDAIAVLGAALDRFPDRVKAGLGLRLDDLPDHYPRKAEVLAWERQYWETELAPGLYAANIDTTLALCRAGLPFAYGPGIRTGPPYLARHMPWYTDPARVSPEEAFYYERAAAATHWRLRLSRPNPPSPPAKPAATAAAAGVAAPPPANPNQIGAVPLAPDNAVAPTGSRANDVLVIVPTRGRPESSVLFAEAFFAHSTRSDLLFVLDEDDAAAYPRLDGARYEVLPRHLTNGKTNIVATKYHDRYPYLAFLGDDHRIRTPGWDRLLVEAIADLPAGIAYGNDLLQGRALPTHVLMNSDIVRVLGFMAPPDLMHLYVDNFWRSLGEGLGSLRYREDVVVEHLHPTNGKAPDDATYRIANAPEMFARDAAAFQHYVETRLALDVGKLRRLLSARTADPPLAESAEEESNVQKDGTAAIRDERRPAQPATGDREDPHQPEEGQTTLRILSATYGSGDCAVDVTGQVISRIRGGGLCITASNNLFGDPCPNQLKTLRLTYTLPGDDRRYTHEVPEHSIALLPSSGTKNIGIFYTNLSVPEKYLRRVLNQLYKARNVDIITCPWRPIHDNPFPELDWFYHVPHHLTILLQILKLLHTAKSLGTYEYVFFLEHDVLYPEDYFDIEPFDEDVLSNTNYIGLGEQGFQPNHWDHQPLHQLAMRLPAAIDHFTSLLPEALTLGGIILEPNRRTWATRRSAQPSVHINHGNHFTSHFSIYANDNIETSHPYWGTAASWWD